jgi:adenylate kinase family enzyme
MCSRDIVTRRTAKVSSGALTLLAVRRVLVTGMSGTGKSTVLAELAKRGHRVVDTDYGGWCEDGLERLWREDRMSALLAEDAAEPLIVSGCTPNQGKFYDRFDAVVLLSAPLDVLLERVASRVTNPYGKDPAERERIIHDLDTVEPLLRATSTAEIDATRPLQEVVDAVETQALG